MLFSDVNLNKCSQSGLIEFLFHILDPACNYSEDERRSALKCAVPCSKLVSNINLVRLLN